MGHQQEETDVKTDEKVDQKPDEVTELPAQVYTDALDEVIADHFGPSHKDCTVDIKAGSAKGDNYVGIVYRVTAKHPTAKDLSVIVKLPPQNAARREQFFVRPCFLRESEFYDTIFPLFTKFQQDKGIDVVKEGFFEVPKCFKSLTDDPHEGLMMEDLKVTGFDMFSRFKETTVEHVNLTMEALGKFHAISFAIKDQKPELMEPYKDMKDIFFQRDMESMEQIKIWFTQLTNQAREVLLKNDDPELIERASKVIDTDFFELLGDCVEAKLAEPHAVLCHGDCWNNNIMYREENGIPVELRLLDWQIMRYCSPVCDLMYYLFSCTVKTLRDSHYESFLDVYYKSLSSFLARLGSDPAKVFPRSVLDEHLKKFGKFGLAMAIMVLPIFTSNPEDTPDMDEIAEKFKEVQDNGGEFDQSELNFSSANTIGEYTKRMDGCFQDMYRLGYI
jgi:hypothetical protein